jgi:flagellar motor protein MotB
MTGAARQKPTGKKLKSDNNVALGDILTLIFGFFVLMVTLNKYAIVQETGVSRRNSSKVANGKGVAEPNAITGAQQITVVTISEKEFQKKVLGKESLYIPENILNNSRTITIEACVPKQGTAKEDRRLWERSAARAQRIGAILRSAGVAPERITVRTLGGHCEVLSQKNKEKQSVAIILR